VSNNTIDPAARQREKQASRDRDAEDLAAGRKTREQLARDNGSFSLYLAEHGVIDWDKVEAG